MSQKMYVVATPCPHGVQGPVSRASGVREYNTYDDIGEAVDEAVGYYRNNKWLLNHPDAVILVSFKNEEQMELFKDAIGTKRYWVSWHGGSADDCRPTYNGEENAPTFPWWHTGSKDRVDCPHTLCAVIDADNETDLFDQVRRYWPEMETRFCELKPAGWMPNKERFPWKEST